MDTLYILLKLHIRAYLFFVFTVLVASFTVCHLIHLMENHSGGCEAHSGAQSSCTQYGTYVLYCTDQGQLTATEQQVLGSSCASTVKPDHSHLQGTVLYICIEFVLC